jgi:hypothetical protein
MQELIQKYSNICAIIGEKERIVRAIKRDILELYTQADQLHEDIVELKKKEEEEKKNESTSTS